MAQHPAKLRWKDEHPYGLSASQFGMALGFCGRVSDYVHYLRHVVGTEKEFKGNEFTAHGISTEPKSRALYELLTGCQVHNGGFFTTDDRILGCSPDGQVLYRAEEKPIEQQGPLSAATSVVADAPTRRESCLEQLQRRSSACSVRVPFKSRRRARSPLSSASLSALTGRSSSELQGQTLNDDLTSPLAAMRVSSLRVESPLASSLRIDSAVAGAAATNSAASLSSSSALARLANSSSSCWKVRLLEIKSPFRALYDSTKPSYEPFGIPLHYMCQIQGQLAIAGCEECDFLVYLDHPACQVEAWRVRRSREFWQWAEPSLRQVSLWVKEGPPDWLNRSFAFPPFDFSRIEVVPLVFPYDISARAALSGARRFSFFANHSSPYDALRRHREARIADDGEGGAGLGSGDRASPSAPALRTQCSVQEWCQVYCGKSWADLTEYERIAVAVQTPVVRFLFEANTSHCCSSGGVKSQEDDEEDEDEDDDETAGASTEAKHGVFCQTLSAWRRLLESNGRYENSATAELWQSLLRTASAGRDPMVQLAVAMPEDWEEGHMLIRCTLPSLNVQSAHASGNGSEGRSSANTNSEPFSDTISLGFFQRSFLVSLLPAPVTTQRLGSLSSLSQTSFATPLDGAPVLVSSPLHEAPGVQRRGTSSQNSTPQLA